MAPALHTIHCVAEVLDLGSVNGLPLRARTARETRPLIARVSDSFQHNETKAVYGPLFFGRFPMIGKVILY